MKKKLFLSLLGLSVLFLGGCSIINNTNNLTTIGNTSGDSHSEGEMIGTNNVSINTQETNNIYCGKKIKIPNERLIVSESGDLLEIKTNFKDTEGYDVYLDYYLNQYELTGSNQERYNNFLTENIITEDCAGGQCYAIKLDEKTICGINIINFTEQPKPHNDGPRDPTINNYNIIYDKNFEILKNSFN